CAKPGQKPCASKKMEDVREAGASTTIDVGARRDRCVRSAHPMFLPHAWPSTPTEEGSKASQRSCPTAYIATLLLTIPSFDRSGSGFLLRHSTDRQCRTVYTAFVREDHDLHPVAQIELHQNVLHVRSDRRFLDQQLSRNLSVR